MICYEPRTQVVLANPKPERSAGDANILQHCNWCRKAPSIARLIVINPYPRKTWIAADGCKLVHLRLALREQRV